VKNKSILIFLLLIFSNFQTFSKEHDFGNGVKLTTPDYIISDIENNFNIILDENSEENVSIIIDEDVLHFIKSNTVDTIYFKYKLAETTDFILDDGNGFNKIKLTVIPLWTSLLPPLLAILLALIFKEVITALLTGIFSGLFILFVSKDGWLGIVSGSMHFMDTLVVETLSDSDHVSIIVFSTLIGGTVALISKNGGMKGIVNRVSEKANTPIRGQLVTWFLGVLIFFDDYANTLVVGNTMRPITDKLKISREKLSYIVDSTAAPVASIAFVTTWIGAELSYIKDSIALIPQINQSAYSIFINSLAYAFYPIFTLVFILMLILTKRDYGSMFIAETKAKETDFSKAEISEEIKAFEPEDQTKSKAFNALIPILIIIIGTIIGLVYTGWSDEVYNDKNIGFLKKLSIIIGEANSYKALLWSSFVSVLVAFVLSVTQKIMTVEKAANTMITGFKAMLHAVIILTLAWSLAVITKDLHTADYITLKLSSIDFSPYLMPAITFVVAAMVAFSTGSSWGTMAILYPLVLPTTWVLCTQNGFELDISMSIFYNTVSCVLAGSVLGDHCSPISDTTILSSMATSCNHIEHVKTQIPYAITVGLISIFIGTLPAAFGISSYILFPLGFLMMYLVIMKFGKVH
jgi:Na+/H+ antiporter NhaC